MGKSKKKSPKEAVAGGTFALGARVRLTPLDSPQSDDETSTDATGVIVDDFGEPLVSFDHYGRDWAHTKRWAIALDSGALVFRNDSELELDT